MSTVDDLTLLRRFEPVIHYTRGEPFFPIDVASYVEGCSLWVTRKGSAEAVCLYRKGELTLDRLAELRPDSFGSVFYLTFAAPLTAAELAAYKLRISLTQSDRANLFQAGRGRLARVGYFSRLANALFLFSLLGRGRVPGDAATAAAIAYKDLLAGGEAYHYCGRVVRENGWLVLQYWFLYAFNNWRSGFYGLNDHEADWEMVCIYLSERPDDQVTPEWVAYASHDFSGDDLRRRWDDPELEKIGNHPVIYAGAGSHASYYTAGEYLVELEIPFLTRLARLTGQTQKFWREKLGQFHDQAATSEQSGLDIFHLPFVEYARGDGLSIGPGQSKSWSRPYIISEPPAWVSQYRGLWGLYVQDPLASENAPGGPMYNRDGTVRRAWYDPVGWAGLDKLPPSRQALNHIRARQATLAVRQAELLELIANKSDQLTGLGVEGAAIHNQPHLKKVYEVHQEQITLLSQEVDQLRAEFTDNSAKLEAFNLYEQQLQQGQRGPARAHIRRGHSPIPATELRVERLMETWAAISTGLMLISLVAIILFAPQNWFMGLVSIVALFFIVESAFRKRLTQLVTRITIGLAVLATLVLIIDYFPHIALITALVAGGYMTWENLRELRS
jgi:hypothetical protein